MAGCHSLSAAYLLFPSQRRSGCQRGRSRACEKDYRSFVVLAGRSPPADISADRGRGGSGREIMERFGLDQSQFLKDSSRKSGKGKKEIARTGRGNREASTPQDDEPKRNRTTHKLLQVLGGTARRKKLFSPKDLNVRPMMEVVRGAAFDIIQAAGGSPASLREGRWLDLYSGTGAVGIEAMSRGCSEAHFVEMDPWVVTQVLRLNLELTGFDECSTVHTVRVERFLEQARQSSGGQGFFDYISVTPPYEAVDYAVLMDQLENSSLIGKDTFVLVEYPLKTCMSDTCANLVKITDRRFGRTNLVIYGPSWAQKKRKPDITQQ
ncbi:methyltransferase [Wolffia australiana]